jgi:hypothetical protein
LAKSNEDVAKELALGFGLLSGAFFIFPLFVFSIPFFILARLIQKPKIHLALSVVGFVLFAFVMLYSPQSYLGLYSVLPFDTSWIEKVVGHPLTLTSSSYVLYVAGGASVSYIWSTFVEYYRSKLVHSKEDERERFKESSLYQKVYRKRFELTAKEQRKWRKQKKIDQLLLGITENGKPYYIDFKEINQHMFVPATTGGGKTVLLLNFIEYALIKNYPFIFIDGKGSRESIDDVKALCDRYGKELKVFSDNGKLTYNPLKYGGATVIKDKLEQLIATESKYYSEISTSLVQALIQFIDDYGFKRDLWTFAKYLDPNEIKKVLNSDVVEVEKEELTEEEAQDTSYSSFLDDEEPSTAVQTKVKNKTIQKVRSHRAQKHYERFFTRYEHEEDGEMYLFKNASSVRTQIYLLLDSELGHLFEEKENGIDLIKMSDENGALFVSFDGLIYDKFIKVIARFLILDLNYLVSYRNRHKMKEKPLLAIYDEFSVYANDKIVDTVNKSRSGGFHCIIATQTLADLQKVDPVLARQVVGNTNTYAIGQTNNPEEVEAWANTLGTFKDIDLTIQTETQKGRFKRVDVKANKGTIRHVQKFKIAPDEIRDLRQGQFIIARKASRERVMPEIIYVRHPLKN